MTSYYRNSRNACLKLFVAHLLERRDTFVERDRHETTILPHYAKDPHKTTSSHPSRFELKPALLSMMHNTGQFKGLPIEEPLAKFLCFIDTVRINNVSIYSICLRLFLFSLADRELEWLTTISDEATTTWDECTHTFLLKYFPLSKSNKLKDIMNFSQFKQEPLGEAWERF
ncbi:hypothetical protein CR513_52170, partial [Mucuna pruriens]